MKRTTFALSVELTQKRPLGYYKSANYAKRDDVRKTDLKCRLLLYTLNWLRIAALATRKSLSTQKDLKYVKKTEQLSCSQVKSWKELTWKRSLVYSRNMNSVKRAQNSVMGVKLGYEKISNFAVLGTKKVPFWVKPSLKWRFSLHTWNWLTNDVLDSTNSPTTVNLLIWVKREMRWQLSLHIMNLLRNAVKGTISALISLQVLF